MSLPPMIPFLERVAALAMPVVPALDAMPLANIFWALGTLRHSPAGACCPLPVQIQRRPAESGCHASLVIGNSWTLLGLPAELCNDFGYWRR